MASVKGQFDADRKARFERVLEVLSANPGPLAATELADMLRQAGYQISEETPKKWPQRGIPERWARRIAQLPRALEAGLSADWMMGEGVEGPRKVAVLASSRPVARRSSDGLVHASKDGPSPQERRMRRELLARRWNSLVSTVMLDDLIKLLVEEERWLRDKGYDDAADETSASKDAMIKIRRELRKEIQP